MKHSIGLAVMAAVLALAACGGGEENGAGGVTKEESEQLNEAAEMLDASPDSLVISNEAELGNGDAGADAAEMPVQEGANQAQ
jgi:ABC-type glycerol-3-phosphate transport system substrate-binding protein